MMLCICVYESKKEKRREEREVGACKETLRTRNDGVFIQIVERYFIKKTLVRFPFTTPKKKAIRWGTPQLARIPKTIMTGMVAQLAAVLQKRH